MKHLLLFVLTFCIVAKTEAQVIPPPYSHYLNHSCEWSLYESLGDQANEHNHYKYYITGDTVIGTIAYYKLFKKGVDSSWNIITNVLTVDVYDKYASALREDAQQRFFAIPPAQTTENLLFDFSSAGMNNSVSTQANYGCNNPPLTVVSTDQVYLGVNPLTRYKMSGWTTRVIEGVGSEGGLLETGNGCVNLWGGASLICFKKDNDLLIVNNNLSCTLSGSTNTAACHARFCYTTYGNLSLFNTSSASLPGDSIQSALINFGDGTPTVNQTSNFATPVLHSYSAPGIYSVSEAITTGSGCTNSVTTSVNTMQSTNSCLLDCMAHFCYSMLDSAGVFLIATFYNTTSLQSPGDSIISAFWDFGDGSILNQTSPVSNPIVWSFYSPLGYNYSVTLTIHTGHCSSTFVDSVFFGHNNCTTTTINPVNNSRSLHIYPTLIHTTATITYNNSSGTATLLLYDATGRKVKEQRLNNATSTLNRNSLRSGIYFYAVVVKDKLVKKGKLIFD